MALTILDEEVVRLTEKLADRWRVSKTEAVRRALENELRRLDQALPLRERLGPLQKRVLARPATGQIADKVFFDALCDET
jgi:antitoxin VapB